MPWMGPARSSSETACCFGELAWILSTGWPAGSGPQDWEWGRGNREGGKSPLGSIRWGPWNAPQDCPLQAQMRALVLWLNPWSRGHLRTLSLSTHPPPRPQSWAWVVPCAAEEDGAGREGRSVQEAGILRTPRPPGGESSLLSIRRAHTRETPQLQYAASSCYRKTEGSRYAFPRSDQ